MRSHHQTAARRLQRPLANQVWGNAQEWHADHQSHRRIYEHLKEAEVIAIAKDAGIIAEDIWKILEEKLGKRNSAAHASSVIIGQLQADALIDDLVKNVVVKIV